MDKSKPTNNLSEPEYTAAVKGFAENPAWAQYLKPLLLESVQGELPKPGDENWEQRYMYSYALARAIGMVVDAVENTASRVDFVRKAKDIVEGKGDMW